MTYYEFVNSNNITISSERCGENPNDKEWKDANHWKCVLHFEKKQLTIYFSKGYGHKGKEPSVFEILECVASDSTDNYSTFEEWANLFGYDEDSHKAERIYNTCKRQTEKTKQFLGTEKWEQLLECEE